MIESDAVDADDGAQMWPIFGAIWTRQQEDRPRDLRQVFAVDGTSIRCVGVTVLEGKSSPVQELWLGTLEPEMIVQVSNTNMLGIDLGTGASIVSNEPERVKVAVGLEERIKRSWKYTHLVGLSWDEIDVNARTSL